MTDQHKPATVAIVGNPNCGKTTVFNALTGSRQRIGNWPGVTVERKEGSFRVDTITRTPVAPFASVAEERAPIATKTHDESPANTVTVVDLPGIYSLSASSQDEVIARDYLLSGEPDLVVNIVDASNIQRNLYLTLQLIEMRVPLLVVLNMMDVAEANGTSIDVDHLAEHLQCPVIPIVATRSADAEHLRRAIADAAAAPSVSELGVAYSAPIERAIAELTPAVESLASMIRVDSRWIALALLAGEPWIRRRVFETSSLSSAELDSVTNSLREAIGDEIDVVLADAAYGTIHALSCHVSYRKLDRTTLTDRIDRVVLNRIAAIPIFFGVMYAVFWFTMSIGGAFIDFFDLLLGTIFVDGFGALLGSLGAPQWLVGLLAGGIGTGIQTVGTFVPIIFALFIALSVLEDSGYMARAAYVMDRFMRAIGLPGRSFVPMMVGFGCSVPAIMATRTLESPRDRLMTGFMVPFMSCGARLPVYALFAAAFFPRRAGSVVFSLYFAGIAAAILTGLALKHTLFRGEISHFVMELPPYHAPRFRHVLPQAWQRLRAFVVRAGITIVTVVTVLSFLNTIGTDGTIGHDDQNDSVLSAVGRAITPVFTPMGIGPDNWPATVGLFTGIFAKEVVVGTLSSLYAQSDAAAAEFDFGRGIADAFRSVPEALAGVLGGLADPLGTEVVGADEESVGEAVGADPVTFARMRAAFTPAGAYAYLLFVLLYIPCVAAVAAAFREMGRGFGWLLVAYTGVFAWSASTLFYQVATGPAFAPVVVAVGLLAVMVISFRLLGSALRRSGTLEARV